MVMMLWHPKCAARAYDHSPCWTHVGGNVEDSLHESLPSDRLLKVEADAERDRLLAPSAEELNSSSDHILLVNKSDSII